MFHVIEKEMKWRREQGLPEGFEALRSCKPIVAVGAEEPLGDPREIAAYYRKFGEPAVEVLFSELIFNLHFAR